MGSNQGSKHKSGRALSAHIGPFSHAPRTLPPTARFTQLLRRVCSAWEQLGLIGRSKRARSTMKLQCAYNVPLRSTTHTLSCPAHLHTPASMHAHALLGCGGADCGAARGHHCASLRACERAHLPHHAHALSLHCPSPVCWCPR